MSADTALDETLKGMSKGELIKYATMTYGLQVNTSFSVVDLITAIKSASTKYSGNAVISLSTDALKPGYARIKINKTELNRQGRPAIVGLNGTMYSLPVGKEITVPLSLVEILSNAVRYEYEPDEEDENALVRREVQSYPFSVLEMAAK